MSEPDPRPAPQYGEYATPEEQRARIARPDTTDALVAGVHPAPHAAPAPVSAPAGRLTNWRLADRIVTIGLLVYGLFNVLTTAPRLFGFATFADDYLELLGVKESFTNFDAARVWGPIAGTVLILGWAVTALLSWRRLRRRRIAFWIPLVGAVVTVLVVSALLTVPLSGDPAFTGFVERLSTGG
ncbi:DUF6264 family protein [Microbacterium lushaniae]|uniref:Uncharacterized protein n=1 Tax=Microbacterium lushaniae TaxID=2614639 RepID=A0A5J6L507_9MICO|nr:DUF6264 family protein [Microbacterium lushaniae]QEW03634.1 hypothetical protein F6J85_11355 [Microbacterium lushaniae]